jgi:hypothetical protein
MSDEGDSLRRLRATRAGAATLAIVGAIAAGCSDDPAPARPDTGVIPDAPGDAPHRRQRRRGPRRAEDVSEDVGQDASPDAAEDVAPDAAEDVAPDAAEDVAPDAPPTSPPTSPPTRARWARSASAWRTSPPTPPRWTCASAPRARAPGAACGPPSRASASPRASRTRR